MALRHRNAAAARADHDHASVEQQPKDAQIRNGDRLGRGHDAPPPVAVAPDGPAARPGDGPRLGFLVEWADEFRRVVEGRIAGVDLDLGQERRNRCAVAQRVLQFLFDQIADHSLGSGVEDIQRKGDFGPVCGLLQGQQADLRAVAVGHHEAVPGPDDPCQRGRGGSGVRPLCCRRHRLPPPEERITAKCRNHQHQSLRPPFPPVPVGPRIR